MTKLPTATAEKCKKAQQLGQNIPCAPLPTRSRMIGSIITRLSAGESRMRPRQRGGERRRRHPAVARRDAHRERPCSASPERPKHVVRVCDRFSDFDVSSDGRPSWEYLYLRGVVLLVILIWEDSHLKRIVLLVCCLVIRDGLVGFFLGKK